VDRGRCRRAAAVRIEEKEQPVSVPQLRQVAVGEFTFDVTVDGPGDGRPILLLHGFPQTAWSWRHVIPRLSRAGYRVLALDQRGYSPMASPDAVEQYRAAYLVADVLGVLDAFGIESVDLVGHDWGAAVAWQVASRHPDRVRTLTALSVPHPGAFTEALRVDDDQRRRSAYMRDFATPGYEHTLLADAAAKLRAVFGHGTGVDVEHVLRRVGTAPRLRRALNWYAAQSLDRPAATPATDVPTLHVWSDQDIALGAYGARATERYVTGPYEFVTLHGVSHWIPEQAPTQTADLIIRQAEGRRQ
jgi:pimeloyl-ACP methyl ester carboxylesterase